MPQSGTRLTAARRRVLEVLRDGPPMAAAELARLAGCGAGVVRDLIAAGLVEERFASAEPPAIAGAGLAPLRPGALARPVDCGAAARRAASRRVAFAVTVLDGVTGSGKTETYFAALAAALGRRTAGAWCCCRRSRSARSGSERFRQRFGALPGAVAFRHSASRAPRHLAGGRRRPGAGRRRRPLGAVPAVPRARADHRRRGARPLLQAGGRRLLPGPRHGGAARLAGRHPDRPGLGDPVARNGRQCRARPLPARRAAAPPRGGRAARRAARRYAPRADRARAFPVAAAGRRARRDLRGRRAGAAVPQSPRLCAADLVPRLRPSLPVPELHRLAGRAPLYRAAAVPSLRPCRGGAGVLPGMPRGRRSGAVRAGGRAPARGGDASAFRRRARR